MKKLLVFTLILSGFNFVIVGGNCSEESTYNNAFSTHNDTENNTDNENNQSLNIWDDENSENTESYYSNYSEEEPDYGENPIFKLAEELGINVQNDNEENNNIDESNNVSSNEIDYKNGYEFLTGKHYYNESK